MTRPSRRDAVVCAVLLGLSVLLALVTLVSGPSSLRLWLLVAVMSTAPGWGLVALRSPRSTVMAWAAAVCASLALSMLLSISLLLAHAWHPVPAFWVLLGATVGALGYHLLRARAGVRHD